MGNNVFRYTSKPSEGMVPTFKRQLHTNMAFACNLRLTGDIRLEFYSQERMFSQDERMFAFTFNTACESGLSVRLARQEIDGAHKKKHLKVYEPNFAVKLHLEEA